MKKPYNLILGALAMCCALTANAGNVVITTNKAVGEKFTLAIDADIDVTVTWGNGNSETITSDGTPTKFNVPASQFTLSSESDITRLYMPEDGITELDVIGVKATLKKLYVPGNELKTLDIYACQHLTDLDVQDNQLESINFFYNLIEMESINCAGNKLKKLEYFQSPRIRSLVVAGNQLTAVPVETLLPQLRSLIAQNNQMEKINLRYSTRMRNLVASNNGLTTLDLSPMTPLKELWVGGNQLGTLDVSSNHELVSLVAPESGLTSIVWDAKNGEYSSLANFVAGGNALHFNSFPTVNDENQPIYAILTPQDPFTFFDRVEVDKVVDIKTFQVNGWGKSVKPTITFYNSKGEEMVKGTDYTMVRTLVFKVPAWSPHVTMEAPDFYPNMLFVSKNFRISGPDAINAVETDAASQEAFTLSGLRRDSRQLSKGIYIINGKKVAITRE